MRALFALLVLTFGIAPESLARHARGGPGPGSSGGSLILPAVNNVSTNWTGSGLTTIGGIPTRTQCGTTISPSGITPPAGGDDFNVITTAEAACTAGHFILLAAGVFQISSTESLKLDKSNITLRGTGTCNSVGGGEPPVAYCQTELRVVDGMVQTYVGGGACGTSPPGTSPCPGVNQNATVQMGADSGNNLWWAGCAFSVSVTGCGAQLTADAAQGATSIQVSSVTHFSTGVWARIDEASGATSQTNPANNGTGTAKNLFGAADFQGSNTQAPTGRVVYGPGGTTPEDGAGYGALLDRPTSEIKQVTNVGTACPGGTALTICFDSPLTIGFRHSSPYLAQIYWPTNQNGTSVPFLTGIGLENLTIERSTNSPILMRFCDYCWVKNVETFLWRGGVIVANSARVQVSENYFHDCADCENNGTEYPLAVDGATSESQFVDNIIRLAGKGMVGRACGGGNVVAYNYVDDTFYQANVIGNFQIDMGVNGSHFTGCHHILFEGNQGDNLDNDETHGNEAYHTFFRNWGRSQRAAFTDPSITVSTSVTFNVANSTVNDAAGLGYSTNLGYPTPPSPMRAAGSMMWDYEMAFVGNVLGISGVTTAGNGYVYSGCYGSLGCGTGATKAIWLLGWSGSECQSLAGKYCSDPNLNGTNTPQLLFRNGNYDYLNQSVIDNAAGYSQSFPSSLYLAAKPSFFSAGSCTYPWPWVTPTASPFIQVNSCTGSALPSKARFDAGTPFVQP